MTRLAEDSAGLTIPAFNMPITGKTQAVTCVLAGTVYKTTALTKSMYRITIPAGATCTIARGPAATATVAAGDADFTSGEYHYGAAAGEAFAIMSSLAGAVVKVTEL